MSDLYLGGLGLDRVLLSAAMFILWAIASWFWTHGARAKGGSSAQIVIAHASQTGTAELLADGMKKRLDALGHESALLTLSLLTEERLRVARKLIIIASTTGLGDAPDGARSAEKRLLSQRFNLPELDVFVLALGDRAYEDFCAFGLRVGEWAKSTGANLSLVTVDNQCADDLAKWDAIMEANELPVLGETRSQEMTEWVVDALEEVAGGDPSPIELSRPGPLFRVRLTPQSGIMPSYEVGDLFEWHSADADQRDFSIASTPQEEALDLIVRRVELPGGHMGKASAALTSSALGTLVRGRIRPFSNFRETSGTGPLLVVAAGSGWAGVRAHVASAIEKGRRIWVIYGERGPTDDLPIFAEMQDWREKGKVARLDVALSRTQRQAPRYVQDCVAHLHNEIASFLGPDGAVAICGAATMGKHVTHQLEQALTHPWIDQARESGRWRSATY